MKVKGKFLVLLKFVFILLLSLLCCVMVTSCTASSCFFTDGSSSFVGDKSKIDWEGMVDNQTPIDTLKPVDCRDLVYNGPSEYNGMFSSVLLFEDIYSDYENVLLRCESGVYYSVCKIKDLRGNTCYQFDLFEKQLNDYSENELVQIESMRIHKFLPKSEFMQIKKFATLSKVKNLDKSTSVFSGEKVSYHYLTGGEIAKVSYKFGLVSDIEYFTDEYNFYSMLLEQDRQALRG